MVSLPSGTSFKFTLFSKDGLLWSSWSFALFLSLLLDGEAVVCLFLFAYRLGILLTGPFLDFVAWSPLSACFTVLLISWNGRFLGFGTFLEDLQLAALYVMNREKGNYVTKICKQTTEHHTKFDNMHCLLGFSGSKFICVTIYTGLTFYQAIPTSQNLLFEFAKTFADQHLYYIGASALFCLKS